MHLFLIQYITTNKIQIQDFFRSAYIWKYAKDRDPWNDVAQYKLHGIIPSYVGDYIKNIQKP